MQYLRRDLKVCEACATHITGNTTAISNEVSARGTAVSGEASARTAADATNATAISNEASRATTAEATKELAIAEVTFATLPTTNLYAGRKVTMTDGISGGGCTVGGGTIPKFCRYDGTSWKVLGVNPLEKGVANGIVPEGATVPVLGTPATYDALGRPFQVGNYAQMFAAGDSYEAALGTPKRQAGFIDTLAADAPAARNGFSDVSISGLTSPYISQLLYTGFSPNPLVSSLVVLDGGANDGNQDTTSPSSVTSPTLVNYANVVNFELSWVGVPYSQRMMASTATKTSGTWNNYTSGGLGVPGTPLNGSQGYEVQGTTAGAVLTFNLTTPANVAALNLKYRAINTYTGTFNVTVDGTAVNENCSGTTTWSKGPCSGTTLYSAFSGQARVAQTIPVTPGSTTHTVTITNVDATNPLYITAVDYLLPTPAANSNVVEYLNTNSVWPYSTLYNTALSNVIGNFRALGQTQMILADQNNGVTDAGVSYAGLTSVDLGPTTACPSGNANHPNCTGHPKVAAILEHAANAATPAYPYAFTGAGDAAAPERFYTAQITTLASAATIAPLSGVVHITGTAAISTITPMTYCPLSGSGVRCTLTLVPDGAFTTAATGNIALASTATVGRAMVMTYDVATAKWYPSY